MVGEYSYVLEEEEDQEDVLERLTGLMGCRHEHQETNGWVVTALSKIIARLGRFPDSVLNHIATYLVNPNPDIQQVSGWVLVCLCCKGVCGYLMGQVRKCIVPFLLLSHPPFPSLSSALPLPLIRPSPPSHRPFPSLPFPLIAPSPSPHWRLSSYLIRSSPPLSPLSTQRCIELCELSQNFETMQEVLPIDASCEDLEVDASLSFLDGFVAEALQNGAQPYRPAHMRENLGRKGGKGGWSQG